MFTHEDKSERERLASMEAGLDPLFIECLEIIGVAEGWRCLEIGAGAGSISEWLCRRVGPKGQVVATDLQTKFLSAIEAAQVTHEISDRKREIRMSRLPIDRCQRRLGDF